MKMKKSEIYKAAQLAVLKDASITPENKMEIIKKLLDDEIVQLILERNEGGETNAKD